MQSEYWITAEGERKSETLISIFGGGVTAWNQNGRAGEGGARAEIGTVCTGTEGRWGHLQGTYFGAWCRVAWHKVRIFRSVLFYDPIKHDLKKNLKKLHVIGWIGHTRLACGHGDIYTDMRRLTTAIRSEKCVVRPFRRCANAIQCTYTNPDSTV